MPRTAPYYRDSVPRTVLYYRDSAFGENENTSVSGRNQYKFSARPSFLQPVTSTKGSYNNYDGTKRGKVKPAT